MKRKNFHDFLLNEYSNHLMLKSKNYYDSTKYYIHLIVKNSENVFINDIDFKYCSDLIVRFKTLKKSTNRLIILLKSVLHFAYDLNLINNISFLKKFKREYKVKRKKVFLEKKELEDVLNFFEQSDKELFYIIKFLTASALRVNDLLEIKFDSINENFINFKNHKRNIFCKLILNNELKDIINYQNRLLQYKKMRLHFHIFRHTCAAIMREQDFSIGMISKKLHHANISTTTMYYLHDTEEKIKNDFKKFAEMQILK